MNATSTPGGSSFAGTDVVQPDPSVQVDGFRQDEAVAVFLVSVVAYLGSVGLGLFRAGISQRAATPAMLIRPLVSLAIVPAMYWLVGYGVVNGATSGDEFVGSTSEFFPSDMRWIPQVAAPLYCSALASLASQEANRVLVEAVLSLLAALLIFPFPARWGWQSAGWLSRRGFTDLGGSCVICMASSGCAMVLVLLKGKGPFVVASDNPARISARPDVDHHQQLPDDVALESEDVSRSSGSSPALATAGAALALVGWLALEVAVMVGFGPDGIQVSPLAISGSVICLAIGMGSGGICTCLISRLATGRFSLYRTFAGMLAGMVACSNGLFRLHKGFAVLLGVLGGLCHLGLRNALLKAGIFNDNPADTMATVGLPAFVGTLITPVMVFGYDEWSERVLWNVVGCLSVLTWSFVLTLMTLGPLALTRFLHWDRFQGFDRDAEMRERLELAQVRTCDCPCKGGGAAGDLGTCSNTFFAFRPPAPDESKEVKGPRLLVPSMMEEGTGKLSTKKDLMGGSGRLPPSYQISNPTLVSTTSDVPGSLDQGRLKSGPVRDEEARPATGLRQSVKVVHHLQLSARPSGKARKDKASRPETKAAKSGASKESSGVGPSRASGAAQSPPIAGRETLSPGRVNGSLRGPKGAAAVRKITLVSDESLDSFSDPGSGSPLDRQGGRVRRAAGGDDLAGQKGAPPHPRLPSVSSMSSAGGGPITNSSIQDKLKTLKPTKYGERGSLRMRRQITPVPSSDSNNNTNNLAADSLLPAAMRS